MRTIGQQAYSSGQDIHGHQNNMHASGLGGHGHLGHGGNTNGLLLDQGDNDNDFYQGSNQGNDLNSLIGGDYRQNGIPGHNQFNQGRMQFDQLNYSQQFNLSNTAFMQ